MNPEGRWHAVRVFTNAPKEYVYHLIRLVEPSVERRAEDAAREAELKRLADEEAARKLARERAIAKLKALGLTDEEISALLKGA